jgi:membrane-associated PAP2 superfamily phosphatase
MAGSTSSRRNPRAAWRRELVILAAVVAVSTAIFWVSNLDIRFSQLFYKPGGPEGPWPYYENTLWRTLYKSDTYLTLMLSAIAIIMILAGALRPGRRALARYGLFILLGGLIGAGLLTNMVFKEYWGHPRPDSIIEFGGELAYLPPLAKGTAGNGESFPSGHVSIASSFIAIWFILRRNGRRVALITLVAVIALSALQGAGRIVRGRHFLSDVLWGAYIPYIVCFLLYYFVFKFHTRPASRPDSS